MEVSHFSDSIAEFTLQDPLQRLQLLGWHFPCPLQLIQQLDSTINICQREHIPPPTVIFTRHMEMVI